MLTITVHGTPAPQGSKRAFVVNGRPVMAESSKKVKPWRQDVKAAALDAIAQVNTMDAGALVDRPMLPYAGPVEVAITFWMPRPAYHYGTGRNAHQLKPSAPTYVDKKPDVDKLLRSTLDALGEAGVWRDDSQVARFATVEKLYATDRPPGARITVSPLDAVAAAASTPPAATVQGALL